MSRRSDIDWDAIERDYRLGQFTLRQLANKYSVEPSSISRKATKEQWVQDLTEEVRGRTRAALLSNATESNTAEAVEAAVQTNIRIIREHRGRIGRGQKMVDALLQELEEVGREQDEIEAAIEDETREPNAAQRRAAMLRAVRLPARASTFVDLVSATKTLVALERQAFNLGVGAPGAEDAPGAPIAAERRRAALALLLARPDRES